MEKDTETEAISIKKAAMKKENFLPPENIQPAEMSETREDRKAKNGTVSDAQPNLHSSRYLFAWK